MRRESTFLASAEIARRAGVITTNYRTADGRYIVSEKALRGLWASIRPEEYVNGLDVELITEDEAKRLIAEGGYQIGIPVEKPTTEETPIDEVPDDGQQPDQESSEEQTQENQTEVEPSEETEEDPEENIEEGSEEETDKTEEE